MLSGVCSGSYHKHHQIQFITNIENHNKTLRKYRERVKKNHKYSESTNKFIVNDCNQLYCWPPQSRVQPVFLPGENFRHNRETFFRSSIQLKSLPYFGCWCLEFTNNILCTASKNHLIFWRTLMVGVKSASWVFQDVWGQVPWCSSVQSM